MNIMQTADMTKESLDALAAKLPVKGPVFMVNLLRYRAQANYRELSDSPTCSGREAYFTRYLPAFQQVAAAERVEGVKPLWVGNVLASVVGPTSEQWDDVAVVEYPSFALFRKIVESAAYFTQADPHRRAALADWRLLATTQMILLPDLLK